MASVSIDALFSSSPASSSDLSTQILSAIFGSGWSSPTNLIAGALSDGVMDSLIFRLLYVLNACGALAIAWLFILTTICATVGAAQDGAGTGGRKYSNAWIPLRYSFAIGAITPLMHGLNAMQIFVLGAISCSISFANDMWTEGLEYVTNTGAISAQSSPTVENSGRAVVATLIRHAALRRYLEERAGCTFSETARDESSAAVGKDWQIAFELPYPQQCTALGEQVSYPSSRPGDTGRIVVSTGTKIASERLANFIKGTLYEKVLTLVSDNALGGSDSSPAKRLLLRSLFTAYANSAAVELSAAAHKEAGKEEVLKEFREHAQEAGWFMAGSYYWSLARLASETVSRQRDDTKSYDPRLDAFRAFASPESDSFLKSGYELAEATASFPLSNASARNPATGKELFAGSEGPDDSEPGFWASVAGFFGNAANALTEFRISSATSVGNTSFALLGENDIVFNVVRASRRVMNACEDAFACYALLRTATKTAEALGNWVPFIGDKIGKSVSAANDVLSFVAIMALVIAAPVWAICWFYAFMLPAIPFIAWFTAVLGWLVLTLEAVTACPIWLVSHCLPEGDGFAGSSARAGYALFMSVLLRPLLLVLAFFLCMITMSVSGTLIGTLLIPFFSASSGAFYETASGFGSGFGLTEAFSAIILIGAIVGIGTWKLFSLITVMPDRILRWAGQLLHALGDDNARVEVREAAQSMQAAGSTMPATTATASGAIALGSRMAGTGLAKRGVFGQDAKAVAEEQGESRLGNPFSSFQRLQHGADPLEHSYPTRTASPKAKFFAQDKSSVTGSEQESRYESKQESEQSAATSYTTNTEQSAATSPTTSTKQSAGMSRTTSTKESIGSSGQGSTTSTLSSVNSLLGYSQGTKQEVQPPVSDESFMEEGFIEDDAYEPPSQSSPRGENRAKSPSAGTTRMAFQQGNARTSK